jgi:acyl carrier protein
MEKENFIKKFAELFDDTDESEINSETKFKELDEWSSLIALSIIALVKTEFGKTITGSQIRNCDTVNDLFEFVSIL